VNIETRIADKIIREVFILVNLKFEKYLLAGIQKLNIVMRTKRILRYKLFAKTIIYF
jgi:hypothetical protein